MPIRERGHDPYRRRMRTSLRAALMAILSGLLLVGALSPTSASALPSAAAPIHYYSLMSSSDGRALAVHPFYPSFSTAVAERYDGTSRMQWASSSEPAQRTLFSSTSLVPASRPAAGMPR
jgi:hypothetical protein